MDLGAARRYVLGRHTPAGGYSFYRTPQWGVEEPNAPDTLAALESLRLLGTAPPGQEGTVRWLRGLQDGTGGYPTLPIGWAALRALDLLGRPPCRSPRPWIRHWETLLFAPSQARYRPGALTEMLHLCELVFLETSTPYLAARRPISTLLEQARDPRGGWAVPGADLETTALAVRLSQLAGLSAVEDASLVDFLNRCEDDALGYCVAPGARTTSAGAMRGGLQLAGTLGVAPSYPGAIGTSIALLQRPDGGLGARHWAIATLQSTWAGLEAAHMLDPQQENYR